MNQLGSRSLFWLRTTYLQPALGACLILHHLLRSLDIPGGKSFAQHTWSFFNEDEALHSIFLAKEPAAKDVVLNMHIMHCSAFSYHYVLELALATYSLQCCSAVFCSAAKRSSCNTRHFFSELRLVASIT